MRFFVVPGIGQLELNGERSGEPTVWSPLKLRPAVMLGNYGYPILGWGKDSARKDGNGARSGVGLDWPRMMDCCQQIILGLILGTALNVNGCRTDYVSFIGPAGPGALLSFGSGGNHGIGNQISIPSRFIDHEISPLLHANRPSGFGAHFLIRGQITHAYVKQPGQLLFHCIVLEMEGGVSSRHAQILLIPFSNATARHASSREPKMCLSSRKIHEYASRSTLL